MEHRFNYNWTLKDANFCGMSVPPVMMANIATEIYKQWRNVFND